MPEAARRLDSEQLRFIVDTMAVAVARCTRDLRYAWVNRVYAEWVGREPEEMIGRPLAEILGDAAMDRIRPNIAQVLAGRRVDYERLSVYPKLGPRWVHAVVQPTFDKS